jgi:hypothetical protein
MQRFFQIIDEVSISLVTLDVERLEEILSALEDQCHSMPLKSASITPAEQKAAADHLDRLRAILSASERNLQVLRNLYQRALEPASCGILNRVAKPVADLAPICKGE